MMLRKASLAAITMAAVLLGLAPAAQSELRVNPNYNLKSDPSNFRGRDQIGLAVSRTDPQRVVAINANYLDLVCEASMSTDGGDTWNRAVPLVPPDPVGTQTAFSPRCAFHQSVVFGSGLNVYVAALATRTAPGSLPEVLIYKSTDGGATWNKGVVAMPGGPANYFRPAVAVDPGVSGAPDKVYAVARELTGTGNNGTAAPECLSGCTPARVAASNDGGLTFSEPVNASPKGVIANDPPVAVVNDDGSLTVIWRANPLSGTPSPTNPSNVGKLQAARSTTPGVAGSWSTPVDITVVKNTGGSTHLIPRDRVTGASTTATYPRVATDPSRPGWIYLVYGQTPPGPQPPDGGYKGSDHFIGYDIQVWFQRSRDRGLTWSAPERVSDAAEAPGSLIHQTRQPNISVSPPTTAGGPSRVNVVWQDRRHWYQSGLPNADNAINDASMERTCTYSHSFCYDIRLGDTYYAYSLNNGSTFSSDIRINDRSHNNDVGYDTRPASGYWSWGPQSVTVANDKLLVGFMDSREGNWDTDTEDYYLAKVDHQATGPDPKTFVEDSTNVANSVALSKRAYMGGNEGALTGGPFDPANQNPPISVPAGVATRNASMIVIANENDIAGAMAGTVLARANPAPVLLSPADRLPTNVKEEISRIRPVHVFVIGGTDKLSAEVISDAQLAAGFPATVSRIDGGSNAGTAALMPQKYDYRYDLEKNADVPAFDAAIIANPATPDAAAAVGLAAARRLPILYVNATGAVPAETAAAIATHDIKKLIVVGGTDEVGSDVVTALDALPSVTEPITRRGGATQYDTSKAVALEAGQRGMPSNIVYVADGADPMDATLLGGWVARATGMLILAPAPLYDNGVAQVGEFGLSGVDRTILLGPATAPVTQPPPGDTTPPPAGDTTPPPPAAVTPPPPPAAITTPPPVAADTTRPRLSGVRLTRTAFKARLGTSIRLTLSKKAKVRITVARRTIGRRIGRNCVALTPITRRRVPCVRFVPQGSLTRTLEAGANTVRFTGRIAGRTLRPGSYRFTLRATDSANRRSTTRIVTFRVVR